jgi:hypothetical protein
VPNAHHPGDWHKDYQEKRDEIFRVGRDFEKRLLQPVVTIVKIKK